MTTTERTTECLRLLNENDPNAIHPDAPCAAANILALARLALSGILRSGGFGTAKPPFRV